MMTEPLTDFELWALEGWYKLAPVVREAAPQPIADWIAYRTPRIALTFAIRCGVSLRTMSACMKRLGETMASCGRSFDEFAAALKR